MAGVLDTLFLSTATEHYLHHWYLVLGAAHFLGGSSHGTEGTTRAAPIT